MGDVHQDTVGDIVFGDDLVEGNGDAGYNQAARHAEFGNFVIGGLHDVCLRTPPPALSGGGGVNVTLLQV